MQQLFGIAPRLFPAGLRASIGSWWAFLYPSGSNPALGINVLYVLVPWIGVMMLGYFLGTVLEQPEDSRRRALTRTGLGATVLFVAAAAALAVFAGPGGGEAAGDGATALWMRMLNQQKYPASQLFLLMTLGPALWLLPRVERARGRFADAMVTFGRVPMFYYLAHIAAIHLAARLVNYARTGAMHGEWYVTAPYTQVPPEGTWTLRLLYLVWGLVVVAVLYPACRWYERAKAAHPDSWLRYL
jgi:uncharacterized membrane protein